MNKNGKYTLIFAALAEMPLKLHDLPRKNRKPGKADLRQPCTGVTGRQQASRAALRHLARLPAAPVALQWARCVVASICCIRPLWFMRV
ncbi:MAG: hypothetical protein ABJH75_26565 [Roseibium sp.]|uniref:hypothetical protein n=1 Tax=Roseibium sp. TaxID=1936156 RepID=UPI0032982555